MAFSIWHLLILFGPVVIVAAILLLINRRR
jgi:hypothetical protein